MEKLLETNFLLLKTLLYLILQKSQEELDCIQKFMEDFFSVVFDIRQEKFSEEKCGGPRLVAVTLLIV